MTIYVRTNKQPEHGPMGPKDKGHPTLREVCPACGIRFAVGDLTTLVALGPGDDEQAQRKAQEGRFYNAIALEVHYACAGGAPAGTDKE